MEIRIRLGMMKDYPSPYEDLSYDLVECKEHVDLSVEAARRSMVLLKNENNMLPLDVKKIRSIAVIGPNANSRAALVGNYQGTSSRYITPLEGIQQYVGDDVRVTYAEGCHLYKNKVEDSARTKTVSKRLSLPLSTQTLSFCALDLMQLLRARKAMPETNTRAAISWASICRAYRRNCLRQSQRLENR